MAASEPKRDHPRGERREQQCCPPPLPRQSASSLRAARRSRPPATPRLGAPARAACRRLEIPRENPDGLRRGAAAEERPQEEESHSPQPDPVAALEDAYGRRPAAV